MRSKTNETIKRWIKSFFWSIAGVLLANLLIYGMPFFDMPKEGEVVAAIVCMNGQTRDIAQEDLPLAAALARGLRHKGRSSQEKVPAAVITYRMQDGTYIEIGADEDVILYKGKCYPAKGGSGGFFRKVATGLFDDWH